MEFEKREGYGKSYIFQDGAIRVYISQLEHDSLWSWVIYLGRVGDHPITINSRYGFIDFDVAKLDCEDFYLPQQKRWDYLNVLYNQIRREEDDRIGKINPKE